MNLKLDRRPERTPSKLTVTLAPDLKAALDDYAELYRRTYGQKESVADIIPFMLDGFIAADAGFRRARKALEDERAEKAARRSPQPQQESET
ncbi:MAG: DUF2274 domain-containing protein [Pseudomonadota bacterium]